MKTITKILTAGVAITAAILLPGQADAQEITGNVNTTVANNYLVNGFSFDNNPTLFLNGSITANTGNTSITALGIHSRDIKNHFNGKTSWVEWTGMLDISKDFGIGTGSVGAYYSALPNDIFGISDINGVYGSFKTNTNPYFQIFADNGLKNINGLMTKLTASGSTEILGRNVNAGVELGIINDYFIKKKGLNHLSFDFNSDIISDGPLKVSAALKYQKGIGKETITGFQGKLTVSRDF